MSTELKSSAELAADLRALQGDLTDAQAHVADLPNRRRIHAVAAARGERAAKEALAAIDADERDLRSKVTTLEAAVAETRAQHAAAREREADEAAAALRAKREALIDQLLDLDALVDKLLAAVPALLRDRATLTNAIVESHRGDRAWIDSKAWLVASADAPREALVAAGFGRIIRELAGYFEGRALLERDSALLRPQPKAAAEPKPQPKYPEEPIVGFLGLDPLEFRAAKDENPALTVLQFQARSRYPSSADVGVSADGSDIVNLKTGAPYRGAGYSAGAPR